jgi:hypothetical protein
LSVSVVVESMATEKPRESGHFGGRYAGDSGRPGSGYRGAPGGFGRGVIPSPYIRGAMPQEVCFAGDGLGGRPCRWHGDARLGQGDDATVRKSSLPQGGAVVRARRGRRKDAHPGSRVSFALNGTDPVRRKREKKEPHVNLLTQCCRGSLVSLFVSNNVEFEGHGAGAASWHRRC